MITQLTNTQKADLASFVEEIFAFGSATGPADIVTVEKIMTSWYENIGKKAPKFVRCKSMLMAKILLSQWRSQDKSSIGVPLDAFRCASLRESLHVSLDAFLGGPLRTSFRNPIYSSLDTSLRESLGGSLYTALDAFFRDSLYVSLDNSPDDFVPNCLWGTQEIFLPAFYVFAERIGCKYKETDAARLKEWMELCKAAGWIYMYENIVFVCDHPEEIHFQENVAGSLLHRDGGPAVRYADGFASYNLHGVVVPAWLAEIPAEKIEPKRVMQIANVDQRREGIRKVGIERMLSEMSASRIDAWHYYSDGLDDRGHPNGKKVRHDYELYKVAINQNQNKKSKVLKMLNPSLGVYHMEFVFPDVETCQEALAWRNTGSQDIKTLQKWVPPSRLT